MPQPQLPEAVIWHVHQALTSLRHHAQRTAPLHQPAWVEDAATKLEEVRQLLQVATQVEADLEL
jgi:hypothetical protein